MSGFWGMTVEQAEQQAGSMRAAAGRLQGLSVQLRATLLATRWEGADAEAFRTEGLSALGRLDDWGERCRGAADQLRRDAEEQEEASSLGAERTLLAALEAIVRDAATAIAAGHGVGTGALPELMPTAGPRLSEQLGEYDDLEDDIAPITMSLFSRPEGEDLIAPDSVSAIVENLRSVSGGQSDDATSIRVQQILGADGENRYVVYIPGSYGDPANIVNPSDVNGNPMDWNQNLGAFNGADTDSQQAVEAAMRAAGIPRGAEVLLAGHSQGGIVAGNLAADAEFNGGSHGYTVTDVVTVGSPVEQISFPSGTSSLNLAHIGNGGIWSPFHPGDPVATLDGNPGLRYPSLEDGVGHQEVRLPATREGDLFANHGIDSYVPSVSGATGPPQQAIQDFERSATMQNMIGGTLRDTVDVAVSRAEGTYR